MADFLKSLKKTLEYEGGYVFDPDDNGGETYKGISKKAHPNWDGWTIIDMAKKDPDFPRILDDSKELTDEVEEVYLLSYWHKIKGNAFDYQGTADIVFDSAVLNGVRTASKITQEVTGAKVDGIIGPKSIMAINSLLPIDFMPIFGLLSIKRYYEIASYRDTSKKYFFGWVKRVFKNLESLNL